MGISGGSFYHQIWGAIYCELHFPVSLTPLFILTLLMLCDRWGVDICFCWEDPGWDALMHKLTHMCVCARRWVRYCTRLRASPRQRQLHVPGPAPSWSWPTFFSPLITPSLIAARHTEAICSTEARRHGDAGRLFGFTVDWPTGKWRSGNGGRVLNSSRGTTSVLWGTYWHYNSTPVWSDTEFKCF